MSDAVVFVCPQCGTGRPLPPWAVEDRVRCLRCETSFRSEGYLYNATAWERDTEVTALAAVATAMNRPPSERKWRLLTCALARTEYEWCRTPVFREALRAAERWAETGTAPRGVAGVRTQLERIDRSGRDWPVGPHAGYDTATGIEFYYQQARERHGWIALAHRAISEKPQLIPNHLTDQSRSGAAALFRELIPTPFLPLPWSPDWFTSTVRDLAAHIDAKREFHTMPVLADALQDAGCDDDRVLTHCRASGPHARGCWVLDAVLGKS